MPKWLLLLLLSPLPSSVGQTIQTDVDLVLVPVTVTDRRGATVNGLDRTNFTLFEDKVPQRIVGFAAEDAPASVGLIFDLSGSMRERLDAAKAALRDFVEEANPEDEAFLFTVSSRPEIYSGFTQHMGTLAEDFQSAKAAGSTALIDTVYSGLERMRQGTHRRRALLVVSDGMDNHSRHSRGELMRLAMEADVQIYTIAIDSRVRTRKPIELVEEDRGLALLEDLADKTGGLHFRITYPAETARVVAKALRAMRNLYVLAYQPAVADQPGKWHKINVKLNVSNTNVSARNGYYSR
jgi:Ca-activated chloride channel family protein